MRAAEEYVLENGKVMALVKGNFGKGEYAGIFSYTGDLPAVCGCIGISLLQNRRFFRFADKSNRVITQYVRAQVMDGWFVRIFELKTLQTDSAFSNTRQLKWERPTRKKFEPSLPDGFYEVTVDLQLF